jgi:methyl-accepting chemotaxis protein
MAGGDLDTPVRGRERADEIGVLARALETFRQQGLTNRALQAEASAARAARDRRQAAMDCHTEDFGQSISGVMASLTTTAEEMRRTAGALAELAGHTRDSAATTAQGAEESCANLGAVAAATEQLSASVAEIARQVGQAGRAAQHAVDRVETTEATVRGLSQAAGQINDVVRLIRDIAGQTNLLALNATIEAARAGEAGKGFAVVASEVKALAGQTARATELIGAQVGAIQTATEGAVTAVREVAEAIDEMNQVATTIAGAIEEQSAATREIASSVQLVARSTEQATQAMRTVSTEAECAGQTSRTALTTSSEIARVSDTLRQEVDQFLAAMRTDESNRRRYERLPGRGVVGQLRVKGELLPAASVQDVSRGGIALSCGIQLPAGTEVEVMLPGIEAGIGARVARTKPGVLALAFRQDPATLAKVDEAMHRLWPTAEAA